MRSIKVALATAAVVGTTISGAYAAGVLNKSGHEVNAHAAHGQSVAAAARAKHTSEPTEDPTATDPTATDEPTAPTSEDPADDQGETADDQGETADDQGETADDQGETADDQGETADDQGDQPSTAPTNVGKHLGQTKPHQHYGHAWGRGHGSGEPAHPKPTHPVHPTHPTHPAHPAKG